MPPYLDHVIILIPHAQLLKLPAWIPENFTVTPGGRHADGKTENKLVCFEDGSYIEFISFINDDPQLREGHWWGDRENGIIDLAFTTHGDAGKNCETVNERLEKMEGVEVRYERPVEGGRKRPDGNELKWKVTFPRIGGPEGFQRGELPFFCHDVTPRSLRVPMSNASTAHPTFGYGIRTMGIYVPEKRIPVLCSAYAAILDLPDVVNEEAEQCLGVFKIPRMNKVDGAEDFISFYIQTPPEDWQRKGTEEREGVMLGDIVIGGLSTLGGNGMLRRIDIPIEEENVGRVFLDLAPPSKRSQVIGEQ